MYIAGDKIKDVTLVRRQGLKHWVVVCPVCGSHCVKSNTTIYKYDSGHTKTFKCTCGGLRARHGMSGTPTMLSWEGMIQRCCNPKATKYDIYGGRGILVCDRWRIFINFFEDMGVRPEGTTLDRIDSNGPYCPENCRWATIDEQNFNTRRIVKVNVNGVVYSFKHACQALGISYDYQRKRRKKGLPTDDRLVFITP